MKKIYLTDMLGFPREILESTVCVLLLWKQYFSRSNKTENACVFVYG